MQERARVLRPRWAAADPGIDLRVRIGIATGLVEPHFMAGWSGGRKVIAPGVAHEDTIRTFHSARFMEDPAAIQCNLDGNPLHEEQLEIVRMLGEVHGLNTVIDEARDLGVGGGATEEQRADPVWRPCSFRSQLLSAVCATRRHCWASGWRRLLVS